MKEYSFILEAGSKYTGGNNFFKDAYEAAKFGIDAGIDTVKNTIDKAKTKLKIDKFSKNHPNLYKGGKIAIAGGSAAYSYYSAIANGLMAKKVTKLIKDLEDPEVDTRYKAVSILIKIGYKNNKLIDMDGVVVQSVSINYELSSKIVGPAIQIIKNPADPNWKKSVIKYLKRQRMYMKIKAATQPVIGTAAAVGMAKQFKK